MPTRRRSGIARAAKGILEASAREVPEEEDEVAAVLPSSENRTPFLDERGDPFTEIVRRGTVGESLRLHLELALHLVLERPVDEPLRLPVRAGRARGEPLCQLRSPILCSCSFAMSCRLRC